MNDNICLPKTHLLILFSVFIGFAVWYIHNDKKKHINEIDYSYNQGMLNNISNTISQLSNKIKENYQKRILLEERDIDVLYNDLHPPERRQPEHSYPSEYLKTRINIPTRGYPDNYQLLGVLLRNKTETAYKLFGRQTFPGSNQWEYFIIGNMDGNDIKLPLTINGNKEIEDGQIISVPGTNPKYGEITTKLYNFDVPRYNPYI